MAVSEMEVVRQFNSELSSIYEAKPPVSKAKMAAITRAAIKSIKYYKHVVHSVEKFIQKCRPEYKLPGLYVVDSIVRQSRHQFGDDRDLFGPRFAKNFKATFQSIYNCLEDEKPRVLRVLNLWQKSVVYSPSVIQPLIDLASHNPATASEPVTKEEKKAPAQAEYLSFLEQQRQQQDMQIQMLQQRLEQQQQHQQLMEQQIQTQLNNTTTNNQEEHQPQQHIQQLQQQQQQEQQSLQQHPGNHMVQTGPGSPRRQPTSMEEQNQFELNPSLLSQIQAIATQFKATDQPSNEGNRHQQRNDGPYQEQQLENQYRQMNPEHNRQSQMQYPETSQGNFDRYPEQQQQQQPYSTAQPDNRADSSPKFHQGLLSGFDYGDDQDDEQRFAEQRRHVMEAESRLRASQSNEGRFPKEEVDPPLHRKHDDPRFDEENQREERFGRPDERDYRDTEEFSRSSPHDRRHEGPSRNSRDQPNDPREDHPDRRGDEFNNRRSSRWIRDDESPTKDSNHRQRDDDPRRMSPRRGYDDSQSRRSRSRSPIRQRRDEERARLEERRKLGLPPIHKDEMSICSVTLWVGHLAKSTVHFHLNKAFGQYGEISSLDLVGARGCAFIVMKNRADANTAMIELRNRRLNGNIIKINWAPGKALKGAEFKRYWDEDRGVTYLPWDKIDIDHIIELTEGAIIDMESAPEEVKVKLLKTEESDEKSDSDTIKNQPEIAPVAGSMQQVPQIGLPQMFQPPPGGAMMPPPGMLPGMPPFPPGFRPPFNMPPPGFRPGMMPSGPPPNMMPPRFPLENQRQRAPSQQDDALDTKESPLQMKPEDEKPSIDSAGNITPSLNENEPNDHMSKDLLHQLHPSEMRHRMPSSFDGMRPMGGMLPPGMTRPPWMDVPNIREQWPPRHRFPLPAHMSHRLPFGMQRPERPWVGRLPPGVQPHRPPFLGVPGMFPGGVHPVEAAMNNVHLNNLQPLRKVSDEVSVGSANEMSRRERSPGSKSPEKRPRDDRGSRSPLRNAPEGRPRNVRESRGDDSDSGDDRSAGFNRRDDRFRDGRGRDRGRFSDRGRDRGRHSSRERMSHRFSDRGRSFNRDDRPRFGGDRVRDRSRERRRSGRDDDRRRGGRSPDRRRDRSHERSRRRSRSRDRSRSKDRGRERNRSKDHKERSRERSGSEERDQGREGSRSRERSHSKDPNGEQSIASIPNETVINDEACESVPDEAGQSLQVDTAAAECSEPVINEKTIESANVTAEVDSEKRETNDLQSQQTNTNVTTEPEEVVSSTDDLLSKSD